MVLIDKEIISVMSSSGPPRTDEPHIRCVAGAHAGQAWRLREQHPLCLELTRKDGKGGVLSFHHEAGAWVFVNKTGLVATVNEVERRRAILVDDDCIAVAGLRLQVRVPVPGSGPCDGSSDALPEVDEAPDAPHEAAASHRSSRRISASCEAVVDESSGSNRISRGRLLSRVGRVLKRRDERHDRLDALRDERRGLIQAFGRLALEGAGGFGLDAGFLSRICAGEQVQVSVHDLDQQALQRFRQAHDQLRALDMEIISLCVDLGLDHDVDGPLIPESLPSEQRQLMERAFAASDGLSTDALDGLYDVSAVDDDAGSSVSGRRRRQRRRKTGH